MAATGGPLTGRQKAAILLVMLGPKLCADVFRHLSEDEIEQLTLEITSLRAVDVDAKERVLRESHERLEVRPQPFATVREADPAQLYYFIQDEHPQSIALILAHLHAEQAAQILSRLPVTRQVDVARRMANLDETPVDVLSEIDATLQQRLASAGPWERVAAGGIDAVIDVLGRMDPVEYDAIMHALETQDPELAAEIRRETIPFDDIEYFDDRDVRRIVADVDLRVWARALKTAADPVLECVVRNMPKRRADALHREMENAEPIRLDDVEQAQACVMRVVRSLVRDGEILTLGRPETDIVV